MAGTDTSGETTGGAQSPLGVDMKLEVVTMPVSDVERAKSLAVTDIEAARADLISRGADVGEVYEARPPGFDEAGRSYFAYASFKDPDGNGWLLQEITTRLPGREWED
jgi:hypothetical protein